MALGTEIDIISELRALCGVLSQAGRFCGRGSSARRTARDYYFRIVRALTRRGFHQKLDAIDFVDHFPG
jgi:hypothetical protein